MNIRFLNYYGKFNTNIESLGSQKYGNYLGYPGCVLSKKLKEEYNINIVNDNSFDIIVFIDLDEELYNYAQKLSPNIKKILILVESPIYTPFPWHFDILSSSIWHKVLSYNRDIFTSNMLYYDIPICGIQMPTNIVNIEFNKACHIASYKNDIRGYTKERDNLVMQLTNMNQLDVYGSNWPNSIQNYFGKTNDKINTISKYKYYLAFENAKYSGYVTEKIADSILAERPCIYFGDLENAQRRFPNTFVGMDELTYENYLIAKEKLLSNYDYYHDNVLKQKNKSVHWMDSYLNNIINAIIE